MHGVGVTFHCHPPQWNIDLRPNCGVFCAVPAADVRASDIGVERTAHRVQVSRAGPIFVAAPRHWLVLVSAFRKPAASLRF